MCLPDIVQSLIGTANGPDPNSRATSVLWSEVSGLVNGRLWILEANGMGEWREVIVSLKRCPGGRDVEGESVSATRRDVAEYNSLEIGIGGERGGDEKWEGMGLRMFGRRESTKSALNKESGICRIAPERRMLS